VDVYEIALQLQQDLIESRERPVKCAKALNQSSFKKSWAHGDMSYPRKSFEGWLRELHPTNPLYCRRQNKNERAGNQKFVFHSSCV
jgi:hypothetical protein